MNLHCCLMRNAEKEMRKRKIATNVSALCKINNKINYILLSVITKMLQKK